MRRKYIVAAFVLAIIAVFYLSNIYLPISGTVVDAESGRPIEGAVVLVEWTKTHGIGEHWTESYKVAEVVTDKNGCFSLPGVYYPFVDRPHLMIYKKGYVAWNNELLFPSYKKRTDYSWQRGYQFKLEQFRENVYKHTDHVVFIYKPVAEGSKIPRFYQAKRWEELMMQKEMDMQTK